MSDLASHHLVAIRDVVKLSLGKGLTLAPADTAKFVKRLNTVIELAKNQEEQQRIDNLALLAAQNWMRAQQDYLGGPICSRPPLRRDHRPCRKARRRYGMTKTVCVTTSALGQRTPQARLLEAAMNVSKAVTRAENSKGTRDERSSLNNLISAAKSVRVAVANLKNPL